MTTNSERDLPGRPPRRQGGSTGRDRGPGQNRGAGRAADGRRPSRARSSTSPRVAAFDVLRSVEESDSYANLLLPPLLRERRIFGRDAGFATELTYGTLRMQGRYDAIIEAASDRTIAQLDPPIRVALRLGAHQILAMRVPAHAAVSETVGLARERISAGPAQLINAVLRKISEKSMQEWLTELTAGDTDRDLTAHYSHPEWIVRAFRKALTSAPTAALKGPDADLIALMEANNSAPEVHLALRPGLATSGDVAGAETIAGQYARTARYLKAGDPGQLGALKSGRVGVQDEGSQLVTVAALAAPIEGNDDIWLDLCAGPGGKAALMGSVLADVGGGTFVANELHPHRSTLVEHNLRAIPESVDIELRTGDGREIGELEPGRYDRVLLDAPCTGLGAIRRRPESRWRRSPDNLPGLTSLQRGLLTSALRAVRPGGVVGYITCSPHVAETSLIVKDATREVVKEGIEVETLDAVELVNAVAINEPAGLSGPYAQLWPHRHGTDAMFLALLRRTA